MKKGLFLMCLVLYLLAGFSLQAQTHPLTGDVNGDGTVNIIDALMAAQYYVGICSCPQIAAGDVDGNGKVDIVDALMIAQYYVGLLAEFPVDREITYPDVVKSTLERDRSPTVSSGDLNTLVGANNLFAFELYNQLKDDPGNLFFSPLSVSYAMAMCYAGANGISESQIAGGMNFTLAEPELHNALNALEQELTSDPVNPYYDQGQNLELKLVNSAWGQIDEFFMPDYLDILARYYGAGMFTVDFKTQPEASRQMINDWVSDVTNHRINSLLPQGSINLYTRLVLTNAIYFKAVWLKPFNPAKNDIVPFYTLNNGLSITLMMHSRSRLAYAEIPGECQLVVLPYEGVNKNFMVIMLPAAGQFKNFEAGLTLEKFNQLYQSRSIYDVTLSLPKFSYAWDSSLKAPLMAMGIEEPFTYPIADFSGINGITNDLYISDILQKSFISVDELGTEAAAATAVILATASMVPEATVNINRPFIYAIYNGDTGSMLFLGRVENL